MNQKQEMKDIFKKIKKIDIKTKELSQNITGGEYKSIFKGTGIEFSEIREYKPGDDIKRIDWKATSRFKRLFVKEYIEERNINICFLVDISPSTQGVMEGAKRKKIGEVVSELVFSALHNNDYLSLILFTDRVEKYIPFKKGRKHAFTIIKELLYHQPQHTSTNIKGVIREVSRLIKKKSVIFLISDFLDQTEFQKEIKKLRKKHYVIAIHIHHPLEIDMEDEDIEGTILLQDAETGEIIMIDANDKQLLHLYTAQREKEIQTIKKELAKARIPMLSISTDSSTHKELRRFFR